MAAVSWPTAGREVCWSAGVPSPRRSAAMLLVTVALLLAAGDKKDVDAAELKKFAGAWAIQSQEHGGQKTPMKELASLAVTVTGAKAVTKNGDEVAEESEVLLLDPKAKPAAIDLKVLSGGDRGKVVKGIYKFDDDRLTLCVAEPGKDRPTEFAGKQGTGHTLLVLLRQKK